MRRLLPLFLLLCLGTPLLGQTSVTTLPNGALSTNASSTIAVTNTFQSIWAASSGVSARQGCTVQNNSTRTMYVYFGAIASATTSNSVILAAGQALNCGVFDVVLRDQVSITGTSGDAFYANTY